jgi:ABC-type nitrate/sulfonate/bicarbonate transport system permease component
MKGRSNHGNSIYNFMFGKKTYTKEDRWQQWLRTIIITIISLTVFVLVWWGISIYLNLEYVPPPNEVYDAFIDSFMRPDPTTGRVMWDNIAASLQRVALGFAIAFVIAVPLGLLMGFSRTMEDFSKPIVEVFRPIPPIAWVPILAIALGAVLGPVMVVFIGVFFPVLSNVIFGVKSIDPILPEAAKTLGANRPSMFSKVIFPYTIPYIMTGIRIGLGIGWMCIVAAEMIIAIGGGVGQYIIFKSQTSQYDYMFAGMIVVAILGLLTTELSGVIERRVSKWMGLT